MRNRKEGRGGGFVGKILSGHGGGPEGGSAEDSKEGMG